MFRNAIAERIASATGLTTQQVLDLLETPPDQKLGDLAFPCFILSRTMKKAPQQIASDLAGQISGEPIERTEAIGPYLNIFLNRSSVAKHVLGVTLKAAPKNERILFEFPAPNTNKPLHVGHLRNMLLGESTARICDADGYDALRTNMYNNRGVHICKSMLAYQRWGEGKTPESQGVKPDHFVGHWYVEFSKRAQEDPSLDQEAQEMLRSWEAGDAEVRALWEKMNSWVYEGHDKTYERLGIEYKAVFHESDIYEDAKKTVLDGLEKGVFTHDEKGNVIAELGKLGQKVVLRADGTSVYMTQDLYLAELRQEELSPDAQVYVVGDEQNLHFQQLFAILEKLGMPHTDRLHHLSYGMVTLPSGRMKSREGAIVDTDNLLDEVESLAAGAVKERYPDLGGEEVSSRAKAIAQSAIRFHFLKYEARTSFQYDPAESLSFEGETGPYVQYAGARISSILREHPSPTEYDDSLLSEEETYALVRLLGNTMPIVSDAAQQYRPHLVARHAMAIAQAFTTFYHAHHVLTAHDDVKGARLALLAATKSHLTFLLGLLGIQALEEM